ncbi:MAG: RNA polymerase sigma factor [Culturomica sp.]|jgi:RNA polymerase sigma-70 factor (ECF subfamily)|nr:RNA polymerase sigma factor [Culturomica sp.]
MDNERIEELYYEEGKKEEAFRLIVSTYKESLYWHIRRILISHDDTDDVLQNTFIKVWKGLDEFRRNSKLSTWIYRIAVNESLNFLSEKRRKVYGNTQSLNVILEDTLESDEYFDGKKLEIVLQKAILKLSERQRLVFNMKYFEEMKYEDIADILGVAVGTLKATYHNAVDKIEKYVKINYDII